MFDITRISETSNTHQSHLAHGIIRVMCLDVLFQQFHTSQVDSFLLHTLCNDAKEFLLKFIEWFEFVWPITPILQPQKLL